MDRLPGSRTLARTLWWPWSIVRGGRCRVDRPIFIVGCPRSGTTLLVRSFASHPALADWSEGLEVWDPDRRDPRAHHVRGEADATPRARRRLAAILSLYVWLRGRQRFVNKLPRNALRIPFLAALFPDCRVIHLIRDGRAVVASLAQKAGDEPRRRARPLGGFARPPGWSALLDRPPAEQFAHLWSRLVPAAREAGASRGPTAYIEVFYEDFCADPRGVLERLYSWADLPVHSSLREAVPASFRPRNDKWEGALSPDERARVVEIMGPLLEELGYTKSGG